MSAAAAAEALAAAAAAGVRARPYAGADAAFAGDFSPGAIGDDVEPTQAA